jgi:hypothetical protein
MEDDQQKPKQPLIPFTPVPLRPRNDGWTVEKQYAFIEALAETGIVEDRRHSLSGGQASTIIPRSLSGGQASRMMPTLHAHTCGIAAFAAFRGRRTLVVTTNIREHSRLSPLPGR